MTTIPLFSVLMSVYGKDNPEYLKKALASIFKQTLLPDQFVLVIDGPIPDTLKSVITNFKAQYPDILDVYPLEKNIGLGPALNYGLLKSRNELVARMDSDDICLPNRMEQQIGYMHRNPKVDVLGANVEEFISQPGDLKRINQAPSGSDVYQYSRWRNPINHPSVVFKKTAVISANSYEDVPFFEDYYLWLNLIHKGFVVENLQDVLVNFRNDIDTIGRRHGLAYVMHELRFLKLCYSNGYLEPKYCLAGMFVRIPLRLIPKKALSKFYHYFLRK